MRYWSWIDSIRLNSVIGLFTGLDHEPPPHLVSHLSRTGRITPMNVWRPRWDPPCPARLRLPTTCMCSYVTRSARPCGFSLSLPQSVQSQNTTTAATYRM